MSHADLTDWASMASAPKDGTRVLALVRASEQGPAEVDVVKWAKPRGAAEAGWLATELRHRRRHRLRRGGAGILDAAAERAAETALGPHRRRRAGADRRDRRGGD